MMREWYFGVSKLRSKGLSKSEISRLLDIPMVNVEKLIEIDDCYERDRLEWLALQDCTSQEVIIHKLAPFHVRIIVALGIIEGLRLLWTQWIGAYN